MNIYELTGSILQLQHMLEDEEQSNEIITEVLAQYTEDLEEKAENYAKIICNLKASAEGLKSEEERLRDRRKAIESNADRLKKNLENAMVETGKKKFKTKLFSFNVQKNPPSVDIVGDIEEKYLIPQAPKIDKRAILTDIKAGLSVSGAELKQTEGLRIR